MPPTALSRTCRCQTMTITFEDSRCDHAKQEDHEGCQQRLCSEMCSRLTPKRQPMPPPIPVRRVFIPMYHPSFHFLPSWRDPYTSDDYTFDYRQDTSVHGANYTPYIGSWSHNDIGSPHSNFGF